MFLSVLTAHTVTSGFSLIDFSHSEHSSAVVFHAFLSKLVFVVVSGYQLVISIMLQWSFSCAMTDFKDLFSECVSVLRWGYVNLLTHPHLLIVMLSWWLSEWDALSWLALWGYVSHGQCQQPTTKDPSWRSQHVSCKSESATSAWCVFLIPSLSPMHIFFNPMHNPVSFQQGIN